jgi:hypothetical protein
MGTLRENRNDIPDGLKGKFYLYECIYYRSNEVLISGYMENNSPPKNVLLLSNQAVAENKSTRMKCHGQVNEVEKPLFK